MKRIAVFVPIAFLILSMLSGAVAPIAGAPPTNYNGTAIRPAFLQNEWILMAPEASVEVDGVLIALNPDGMVLGLDAAQGSERWRFDAGSVGYYPPYLLGALLIAGNDDGDLFALDPATGTQIWSKTDAAIVFPPVGDATAVYAGSVDGSMYALDAATGAQLWSTPLVEWGVVGPTLADGRLFAATKQSTMLIAVDAATGAELWRADIGAPSDSPPVVSGGLVLAANYTHNFYVFDAATGASYCTLPIGDVLFLAPPDEFGNVFSTSLSGVIAALLPESCSVAWFVPTDSRFVNPPIVASGLVYVPSQITSTTIAIDAVSGGTAWTYSEPNAETNLYFSVSGDTAYVAQGALIALSSATGLELWRFTGVEPMASKPFRAQQSVIAGDTSGLLYAVDPATGQEIWRFAAGGDVIP